MILYIGSDHVIQQPGFDLRQSSLTVTADSEIAADQACRHNAAGVINAYRIDLDAVTVKMPGQLALEGWDTYDVLLPDDPADSYISLCSHHALDALEFIGASFVHQ